MKSRSFPRIVYRRTEGEGGAARPSGSSAPLEDALLILADIIEDMLDEVSGSSRPAPDADGVT